MKRGRRGDRIPRNNMPHYPNDFEEHRTCFGIQTT